MGRHQNLKPESKTCWLVLGVELQLEGLLLEAVGAPWKEEGDGGQVVWR